MGHHRCTFGEGHVTQGPVEFVHVDDDELWRFRADCIERAELVGCESQEFVGQLTFLSLDEIVEKQHHVGAILGFGIFHHLFHLVVIAEMVFVVNSKSLFQEEIGLAEFPYSRVGEALGCVKIIAVVTCFDDGEKQDKRHEREKHGWLRRPALFVTDQIDYKEDLQHP